MSTESLDVDLYADVVDTFPQAEDGAPSLLAPLNEVSATDEQANSILNSNANDSTMFSNDDKHLDMLDEVFTDRSICSHSSNSASLQPNTTGMQSPSSFDKSGIDSFECAFNNRLTPELNRSSGDCGVASNIDNRFQSPLARGQFDTSSQCPIGSVPSSNNTLHTGKRVSLYVQNLTWWTTDEDIKSALDKLEIDDVVEIRFLENRVNGQSRGIAIVTIGSENSARTIMEKLPKQVIRGLKPDVSHANRHHLHHSESPGGSHHGQPTQGRRDSAAVNNIGVSQQMNLPRAAGIHAAAATAASIASNANALSSLGNPAAAALLLNQLASQATSLMQQRQNSPHIVQSHQHRPQDVLAAMAQHFQARLRPPQPPVAAHQTPPISHHMQHPRHQHRDTLSGHPFSPAHHQWPGSNRSMQGLAADTFSRVRANHNFPQSVPSTSRPSQQQLFSTCRDQFDNQALSSPGISNMDPIEVDQLLERNKVISSNALAAAVQSASDSNYATAIETLVTAISLIRQSKIVTDERSQILISNLQDTLKSIEEKSVQARKQQQQTDTVKENERYATASATSLSYRSSPGKYVYDESASGHRSSSRGSPPPYKVSSNTHQGSSSSSSAQRGSFRYATDKSLRRSRQYSPQTSRNRHGSGYRTSPPLPSSSSHNVAPYPSESAYDDGRSLNKRSRRSHHEDFSRPERTRSSSASSVESRHKEYEGSSGSSRYNNARPRSPTFASSQSHHSSQKSRYSDTHQSPPPQPSRSSQRPQSSMVQSSRHYHHRR